ncbi:methionine ABC transporter ATP-binding protein [Microbacterium sp. Marseille-Q6965]|uniref:methionine ABC transporter ATP-binding protein n=1 Tax=Microbacterium sp. Marseille-Q6965 TaxID=2965072 RepID=UPI0021B7F62B|nr:ATP-binding cassette domain-containing protein [Microbacterium sp. Marseille-Q6965]
MSERIRLAAVTKQYPSKGRSTAPPAIDGVDLSIEAGEIYGLIGRSGAGKSTLLRMINGLEKPTAGRVLVDGVDVHALAPSELRALRHGIGMVFQQFSLWNSRTVFGNIATPLKIAGWKDDAIARRVGELIDFVGLQGKAFARPRQLSGGQKQRVGIARAIAARPSILLSDEATSALDPQTTTGIVDLLRSVNREFGITIVVVTHEMDVVSALADRVSILSEGRVVESGDIHQILARPRHPVTAGLVGSYTGTTLTEREKDALRERFTGRRISVTVDAATAESPLLSRLARENGVDFAIIQGGVARVRSLPYGQLSLALHGDDAAVDRFIAQLGEHTEVIAW